MIPPLPPSSSFFAVGVDSFSFFVSSKVSVGSPNTFEGKSFNTKPQNLSLSLSPSPSLPLTSPPSSRLVHALDAVFFFFRTITLAYTTRNVFSFSSSDLVLLLPTPILFLISRSLSLPFFLSWSVVHFALHSFLFHSRDGMNNRFKQRTREKRWNDVAPALSSDKRLRKVSHVVVCFKEATVVSRTQTICVSERGLSKTPPYSDSGF